MKVNIKKFKKLLDKTTINHSIDSVKWEITKDNIQSKLIKRNSRDAIAIINVQNDIFDGLKKGDEYTFSFSEPALNVKPYLNLIDEEELNIIVNKNSLSLKSEKMKSKIQFADPDIVSTFDPDKPKINQKPFIEISVDENFLYALSKIKKIGNKFGKIYFGVEDNIFYIESTDKNTFSNNVRFDICECKEEKLSICIDYSNFINVFNILDDDKSFSLSFTYLKDKDMGMISCFDKNNTENYYLMSKMD